MPVPYTLWGILAGLTSEPNPAVFRGANLLLHGVNSFLVLLLLQRWPGFLSRSLLASLLGALLFLVHPTKIEAVVWISATKDLLAAFFALAALNLFLNVRAPGSTQGPTPWKAIVWTYVAIVLAGLSKMPSLAVCLVLLGWDLLLLRTPKRQVVGFHLPLIALLIAGFVIQDARLGASSGVYVLPWLMKISLITSSVSLSLGKLMASTSFHFDYGHTPLLVARALSERFGIFWLMTIAVTVAPVLFLKRSRRPVSSAVFWSLGLAVILLIPTSGVAAFIFGGFSTVTDRYLYLPSIGLSLFFAYLWRAAEGMSAGRAKSLKGMLGLALVVFALLGFRQVEYWKSSTEILEHTAALNPESILAHEALANIYGRSQEPGAAERAALHRIYARQIIEASLPSEQASDAPTKSSGHF